MVVDPDLEEDTVTFTSQARPRTLDLGPNPTFSNPPSPYLFALMPVFPEHPFQCVTVATRWALTTREDIIEYMDGYGNLCISSHTRPKIELFAPWIGSSKSPFVDESFYEDITTKLMIKQQRLVVDASAIPAQAFNRFWNRRRKPTPIDNILKVARNTPGTLKTHSRVSVAW